MHHSGSYATPEQLHESDVVVITHAAFTNAKRDTKEPRLEVLGPSGVLAWR